MRRGLLLLVPLLLVAACGGSDDESSAPSSTTTTAPPVRESVGCGSADANLEGRVDMASGRWYLRSRGGDGPLPLVVDFHGYSEGAEIHAKLTDLSAYGRDKGFHVITPQGTGDPVRWDATVGSPDMAFFDELLDTVESTMCVDLDRIYVTGLSNGAFMASAVGCEFADRVAAIGPVAGIRDPEGCQPSRPIPVVTIHGTDDQFVTYDGGLGEKALDLPAPDGSGRTLRDIGAADQPKGPSIPEIVAAWAERNGCPDNPGEFAVADDVILHGYDCPHPVALYRVEGGGHSWPGSPLGPQLEDIVGHTTDTVSANRILWTFFSEHPLDEGN